MVSRFFTSADAESYSAPQSFATLLRLPFFPSDQSIERWLKRDPEKHPARNLWYTINHFVWVYHESFRQRIKCNEVLDLFWSKLRFGGLQVEISFEHVFECRQVHFFLFRNEGCLFFILLGYRDSMERALRIEHRDEVRSCNLVYTTLKFGHRPRLSLKTLFSVDLKSTQKWAVPSLFVTIVTAEPDGLEICC